MSSWNAVEVGPGCSVLTRKAGEADQPDHARRDDDAAAVGHVRRAVLEDVEGAEDVDGERAHELVRRVVDDRRDRAADAGVAEEDVEAPESIDTGGDRGLHRALVRDVGDRGERVVVAELAGGGLELRLVDADEMDLRTLGDEQARGREADPALSAGDQRDLVLHPSHGDSSLFLARRPAARR